MRFDATLRIGLAALIVISLGGCATNGPDPGLCAMVGGTLGGAGGGVGGYVYSHEHHRRDYEQLEGSAIGVSGLLVGAGLGYLICNLMEDEAPKPAPRRAEPTPAPAPPPRPAPAPLPPDACTGAVRLEEVQFGNDKSDITPQSAAVLDELATTLRRCPETRVRLSAHTDSSGSEAYNQALSQRRADSVKTYLVQQGISESRIEARGFGEANPIANNDTAEGRAKNRRVEIEPIE